MRHVNRTRRSVVALTAAGALVLAACDTDDNGNGEDTEEPAETDDEVALPVGVCEAPREMRMVASSSARTA